MKFSRKFILLLIVATVFFVVPSSAVDTASKGKESETKNTLKPAADTGKKKTDLFTKIDDRKEPPIVYATPDLAPDSERKINISDDMEVRNQIAILVAEIEKLKTLSSKITVIVSVDLQMTNPNELDGVEIYISGGTLEKPISCETNHSGQCVFVLPPLPSEKTPDYRIKTKKAKFKSTEKKIRLKPGAVVFLPIRVDLLQQELDMRTNPPIPSK